MKAQDALESFREFALHRGADIMHLSAREAVELMSAFYQEVRADDCGTNIERDMLLFQWGTYDWWGGDGEFFEYEAVRQMIPEPQEPNEAPDSFIWQLAISLKFLPSDKLRQVGGGSRWCVGLDQLDDFMAFIRGCEATVQVAGLAPRTVQLRFENVE